MSTVSYSSLAAKLLITALSITLIVGPRRLELEAIPVPEPMIELSVYLKFQA
jgi:hypothetical protein